MTKNILVTGGLGFIGYHLCKQITLVEPDSNLTIVDNLSSTRLDYSDLADKANILIQDFKTFSHKHTNFDEIYHLASPVGSLGILKNNGRIALDILELAEKAARVATASASRLLYVSSSEIYGKNGAHSEHVEHIVPPKRGTRMEYSLGKITAEHVLLNLASDDRFSLRIVRPFNAMGECQSSNIGFVVPRFIEAAMTSCDLLVYGTGEQKRSFCHVQDLVDGLIAVQHQGRKNEIYNVGNPNNIITINQLSKKILDLTQSNSQVRHVDPTSLYGKNYIEAFDKIPMIDRAITHTDWEPIISLDLGLRRTLDHYQGFSY